MIRALFVAGYLAACLGTSWSAEPLSWSRLPSLPDREGLAGPFGGTQGDHLIVAGGANFPNGKPWEGGAKVWHNTIFVLDSPTNGWRIAGRLPRPLGYGVSLSTPDGIICAGGSDANRHHAEVFLLRLTNGAPEFQSMSPLPHPCANAAGALLNSVFYIAGGLERPDATRALRTFWALDLSRLSARWRELESWPGPERMFATVGIAEGSLFLFGGAALEPGADGKPVRRWLRDAYQFIPSRGWKRIADLPRVAVAAPSPAPLLRNKLLILGGDDGSQAATPPTEHRGFRRDVLAYDLSSGTWATIADTPFAFVTTPVIDWDGRIVLPGGEVKPGIRSAEVWSAPRSQP